MAIRARNKRLTEFNMSSLTDIIFLLLIFFLLTSKLTTDNAIPMQLPNSNQSVPSNQNLAVSIDKYLQLSLNGKPIAIEMLETSLTYQLAGKQEKGIILYADKSVPIENVVQVLNVANKMKIKVVLATKPDEGS